jgi:hypothetical protein
MVFWPHWVSRWIVYPALPSTFWALYNDVVGTESFACLQVNDPGIFSAKATFWFLAQGPPPVLSAKKQCPNRSSQDNPAWSLQDVRVQELHFLNSGDMAAGCVLYTPRCRAVPPRRQLACGTISRHPDKLGIPKAFLAPSPLSPRGGDWPGPAPDERPSTGPWRVPTLCRLLSILRGGAAIILWTRPSKWLIGHFCAIFPSAPPAFH